MIYILYCPKDGLLFCLSYPHLSCLFHLQISKRNPRFCSKEIAIYRQDLLKIKYNKDISGNIPLTMQAGCQATSKTQCITHSKRRAKGQTLATFFSIQVIFILLGVFSIGFMVAEWPCAQTLTHIHTCDRTPDVHWCM